jgi:deazaflavin-dependent oxidoreductase (nitroreductase family)
MGVAAELGYQIRLPNAFQRGMQSFGATRAGAWLFSKTLRHADDIVGWLTSGRQSVPQLLAGLPVIDITTTGRKSRQRRRTHLVAVPLRDTLAVLGTNFGQPSTPAWALNLEADPHATVRYRDRLEKVVARMATAAEETEVWTRSAAVYGGYAKYRERINGRRRVRVFVLEPDRQVTTQ